MLGSSDRCFSGLELYVVKAFVDFFRWITVVLGGDQTFRYCRQILFIY